MQLRALTRLAHTVINLTGQEPIRLLGSASLLGFYPEIDGPEGPLSCTYDADFSLIESTESLAKIVREAIGVDSLYHREFGYFAEILHPDTHDYLLKDWETRLHPLSTLSSVLCLNPYDLAVVKMQVGRPKDLELIKNLLCLKLLDPKVIRQFLDQKTMVESLVIKAYRYLDQVCAEAEILKG
jgi:hypothetical protein